MFLLIQMLLPQKQEKQPNQPLGVGSHKSHLWLGSAGCQPGAAGGDTHCSRHWPWPPGTAARGGNQTETLRTEQGLVLCVRLKNPLKHSGAIADPPSLPSDSSGLLRHRHTHKAHHHRFSSWLLVVSTANSAWAFYNHSSSCHILISCQRDAYVFPFPLSLAQWWQRQVLLEIFYSLPRKMNCLALYWSAASLALFHENTLLSMQADTYIFQCWVQLPHLLTLTMETKRPICWEKHSGIIL